jgi:hypothetical protein
MCDLYPTPVRRMPQAASWNTIDSQIHDESTRITHRLSTPLSSAMFSNENMVSIQYALRKAIILMTQKPGNCGVDVGMQNKASIHNELTTWYGNHKYNRINYKPSEIPGVVKKLNYAFVTKHLIKCVMNSLEDKILYESWALKVPEPMSFAETDNNYDRSVNMSGYWDESLGNGAFTKNNWDWSKSGMYDEPESLYKRYPSEARSKNARIRPKDPRFL